MSWEALAAIGSFGSAVVIAVSAWLAVDQLKELQRATEFDGTERMLREFYEPEQRIARRYVMLDLPRRLKEQSYRAKLESAARIDPRAMDLHEPPECMASFKPGHRHLPPRARQSVYLRQSRILVSARNASGSQTPA